MNQLAPRSRRSASRMGFTLVELMIAMLAGSFAIAGVYYLGGMSSRVFNEQMRVSETQMSLRSAMEQLRRDISRAGYLGTPNVSNLQAFYTSGTVSTVQIQAISITPDGSLNAATTALLDPTSNPTRIDRLDLVANYTTADAYWLDPITDPSTLTFNTNTESFARSFVDPACGGTPSMYNESRFQSVFAPNRWVRIETETTKFFRQISASNSTAGNVTVTLSNALDGIGATGWAVISPLDRITYSVQDVSDPQIARLVAGTNAAQVGAQRAVLVREETNIATGASNAGTLRPVLDYAVEFAVDGLVDTAGLNVQPVYELATPGGAQDLTVLSANNPDWFRGALVTLSTRTPEADPRIGRVARASLNAPFVAFRLPGMPAGAELWSRVRTLRAEIFMPNLASPR